MAETTTFEFFLARRTWWKRYAVACLALAAALGARFLFDRYVRYEVSPYILFYPAVMIAAWYGGFGPGAFTTFTGLGLGFFFFNYPAYSFSVENFTGSHFIELLLFVFVSLILCSLTQNLYYSLEQQNKASREVLRSQNRIANILTSIQGCFFSIDENSHFIHVNSECRDFIPSPEEDFLGKLLWDIAPQWKGSDIEKSLQSVLEGKEAVEFEFYDRSQSKWFDVHMGPSNEGVTVHLQDITSRKISNQRQAMEHKITQLLASEAGLDETFSKILETVAEEMGWDIGAYWEIDSLGTVMRHRDLWVRSGVSAEEFCDQTRNSSFKQGTGFPGHIWASGKGLWLRDISEDRKYPRSEAALKDDLRLAVGFPIKLGSEILGVMEFFASRSQEPDNNLMQTLESIGSEIGQYLERQHAEAELKAAYEEMEKRVERRTEQLAKTNEVLMDEIQERKKVEKDVLEISQKEQRRLGVQIHDELCQSLTGIMMITKVLTQKMERQSLKESVELKKITDLMDQSITQAKEMARGFYPVELQADSLMIVLKELAERTEDLYKISCRFACPVPILLDDHNIATHLYRIVQESIHNAIKHGNARTIEIGLIQGEGRITMRVRDDGRGIPSEPEARRGIGLHIMKYRARMIDADLQIDSQEGRGTTLTCTFPYPPRPNPSYAGAVAAIGDKKRERL